MRTALLARLATGLTLGATVAAFGQVPPAPAAEDTVLLSPFLVSGTKDRGYRASNSVSATRLDTPIQDLPFAIQAFTAEFIDDLKPTSLLEIARWAPGVSSEAGAFTGGINQTTLRGFNNAPYRNGFFTVAGNYADPYNVARVEVVKGPSSLLYGQIAPGGLVNYITKRPTEKTAYAATFSIGSHAFARGEFDANVAPAGGAMRARVLGLRQENDRYAVLTEETRTAVNPQLEFLLGPQTVLHADYDFYRMRENRPVTVPINGPLNGSIGSGPYIIPTRDFNFSSNQDYRDTDVHVVSADLSTQLEAWTVRAGGSFTDRTVGHLLTGQANGRPARTAGVNANVGLTDTGIFQWRRTRFQEDASEGWVWQVEATREWELPAGTIRGVVGYQRGHNEGFSYQVQVPTANSVADWNLLDRTTWNRNGPAARPEDMSQLNSRGGSFTDFDGAYVLALGQFLQRRLNVVAGVRRSNAEGYGINYISNTVNGRFKSPPSTDPQIGVLFKVTPGLSLFASRSESFVPQAGNRLVESVPVGPLPPVTGLGYDVGLKTSFNDGRVSFTLTYFDLENEGFFRSLFNASTGNFNTAPAGVQGNKGIELDGTWSPTDSVQVYASYAHFDAKVIRDPTNSGNVGTPIPTVPDSTWSVLGKYRFTQERLKGLSVGGGASYTDRKIARADNLALYLPANTLVNLFASYEVKLGGLPWKFDLSVDNVTDKEYLESTFLYGEPRSFRLTAGLRF